MFLRIIKVQTTLTRGPKKIAYRLIFLQSIVTAAAALLMLCLVGRDVAFAVIMAGACVVLANVILAGFLFRGDNIQTATRMVSRFYAGELCKLVFCAAGMAWAIAALQVAVLPFLLMYGVLQLLVWPVGIMRSVRSIE